jgi:hypothetical protein
MGLFSALASSWKKSSKLRKLQLKIAPPADSVADLVSNMVEGFDEREQLLEEFLDLCEADEGVKKAMAGESLSRADLKRIYKRLVIAGLGQWIKGHYAALSTIAYFEPLLYVARSEKQGTDWQEVVFSVMGYWEGRIPNGGLLQRVKAHGSTPPT